jgi:hypothetical protein
MLVQLQPLQLGITWPVRRLEMCRKDSKAGSVVTQHGSRYDRARPRGTNDWTKRAATIELLGADMGSVQLWEAERNVLLIAAQRGLRQEFVEFFREVSVTDESAAGRAMRTGETVVIEDIERDEPLAPLWRAMDAEV